MIYIIILIIGAFFGSFLKVLADRIPRGESPIGGRSQCEFCKHLLSPLDLIPVFSFILLGGKCRYCHKKLSWEYPISELITGVVFGLTFLFSIANFELGIMNYEFFSQLFFNFFVVSGLLVIFFADIKYYIIPFQILLPSLAIVVIWHLYFQPEFFLSFLISGLAAFAFFLFIFLITKGRGMGFGDVILALYMGVLLGFPNIVVALYVAFLTGAIVSIILILTGKKELKGGVIPFGPFLIFGTYIALFWGVWLGQLAMTYLNI